MFRGTMYSVTVYVEVDERREDPAGDARQCIRDQVHIPESWTDFEGRFAVVREVELARENDYDLAAHN